MRAVRAVRPVRAVVIFAAVGVACVGAVVLFAALYISMGASPARPVVNSEVTVTMHKESLPKVTVSAGDEAQWYHYNSLTLTAPRPAHPHPYEKIRVDLL